MLFQPSLNKNLRDVAQRAIQFSNQEKHKDAQRLRRLTRHAIEETDHELEKRIERVFAIAAFVGVCFVLLMVQLGIID